MIDLPVEPEQIIVTSSRLAEAKEDSPATVSTIDRVRMERLGEPLAASLLRLLPSTSVSASGPSGSLTQVRIRGAEANHSLLFVDGIRVNDPASGNEPRFELLNADLFSRIEVVRGPQSALWGSEAVGGVVAVRLPHDGRDRTAAQVEAGNFGFRRTSFSAARSMKDLSSQLAVGWQESDGIDAFDGNGDSDGYQNLSGRTSLRWQAAPALHLGINALALTGRSQFDGYSPVTFLRDDTLDNSRNQLLAARADAGVGDDESPLRGKFSASILTSRNCNFLDHEAVNRTHGRRWTLSAQTDRRFAALGGDHTLVVAIDHEVERFRARDVAYGGLTNQDRGREHQALTVQWRGERGPIAGDIAVRHDWFSEFSDATTLRASILGRLGGGASIAASYGEGIAQPTFFDLYGFFPNSFSGNPSLGPESSQSFEMSLRLRRANVEGALTTYAQSLEDEIVDVFDPATFLSSTANRDTKSRRKGLELEIGWRPSARLRLTATYALLDATEPGSVGANQVREPRRPRHSGGIAADGVAGRLTYGVSIAYTDERIDTDFDSFPARKVRLGAYWLAGARVGYAITPRLDLFGRISNLFDQRFEDVYANRTEGRAVHAGIRFSGRD